MAASATVLQCRSTADGAISRCPSSVLFDPLPSVCQLPSVRLSVFIRKPSARAAGDATPRRKKNTAVLSDTVLYRTLANASPQSNLRRACRSSADKTSTRIANYRDRHSKRVEPSKDSARLGSAYASYACIVCFAAAKMTAGRQLCCYRPIAMLRLFCYVFAHEFLFNPHFDLELTIS